MAGRYVAGAGQLLLAVAAAVLIFLWFFASMAQMVRQLDAETPQKSAGWLGLSGALVFAISWLWALVTSVSLLRHARAEPPVPPKIDPP